MNRRIIAGSMVMATLIFSGCSAVPDGTISWEKQSADGVVIENNHVKGTLVEDTVYVDAYISGTNNNTEWKEYTATLKNIDDDAADRLGHVLLDDSAYLDSKRESAGDKQKSMYYTYKSDNTDAVVYCHNGSIVYDTAKRKQIQYTSFLTGKKGALDSKELHSIYPLDSIEGLDKEEAVAYFKKLCDETGVDASDNIDVYAFDKDSANAYIADGNEYLLMDKYENMKPLLTDDDEAYIIIAPLKINGVELPAYNTSSGTGDSVESKITAVIGRNGLYYFGVSGLYDISDEEPAEGIHSINDLMDYLKTNYQYSSGVTRGIKISDISLQYIARYYITQDEFKIVPTYVCKKETTTVSEKEGVNSEMVTIESLYVDARNITYFEGK